MNALTDRLAWVQLFLNGQLHEDMRAAVTDELAGAIAIAEALPETAIVVSPAVAEQIARAMNTGQPPREVPQPIIRL